MYTIEAIRKSLSITQPHTNLPQASVALIFRLNPYKDLEVLFVKRSFNNKDKHSGQIALPGGKVEIEENSLQAVYRETFEEIGVRLNGSEYLGHSGLRNAYQSGLRISELQLCTHLFFLKRNVEVKLNTDEMFSFRWVKFRDFTHDLKKSWKMKRNEMVHEKFKTWINPSGKISGEFPGMLLGKSEFCESTDFGEYHLWGATLRIMRETTALLPSHLKSTQAQDWVTYSLDYPHKLLTPLIIYHDLTSSLTYHSFIL